MANSSGSQGLFAKYARLYVAANRQPDAQPRRGWRRWRRSSATSATDGSPAGEAKRHFHDNLFGRSPQQRARFRQRVLEQTAADLQRVAQNYLRPELASTAIITSQSGLDQAREVVDQYALQVLELL